MQALGKLDSKKGLSYKPSVPSMYLSTHVALLDSFRCMTTSTEHFLIVQFQDVRETLFRPQGPTIELGRSISCWHRLPVSFVLFEQILTLRHCVPFIQAMMVLTDT